MKAANEHASTRSRDWYEARLALPQGLNRVVIDTDAANEIDDQFAIAWALLCPEAMQVEAIYAAPFSFAHRKHLHSQAAADALPFASPEIGMHRSYDEIIKVYELLGQSHTGKVWHGSPGYLQSLAHPIKSPAAEHLISLARQCSADQPLYVLALGCVTNTSSALLLAPDIADKIVVVWTSGFPSHAPHANHAFNLEQDMLASQWLFRCGVPLVYLPGYHVGAQLRLSLAEMELYVKGQGAIGDYLFELFTHNPLWPILGLDGQGPHSWVIWDIINIAWMIDPTWVQTHLVITPVLGDDKIWRQDPKLVPMREGFAVQRDNIFNHFFSSLAAAHTPLISPTQIV